MKSARQNKTIEDWVFEQIAVLPDPRTAASQPQATVWFSGLTKSILVIGTLKPSQQDFILIFPIVIQELLHKTLSANQECDN